MPPKTVKFKVISNEEIVPDIRSLKVEADQDLEFLAGQYYSFKIADKVNRSYSIASKPNGRDLEFIIEIIPNGVGSTFVLGLEPGDTFESIGPLGFFNLVKTGIIQTDDPILFVGTGVGITPILSIIRDQLVNQKSNREMHLYFGLRYEDKAYLFDEFRELSEKYPNFHFTPVISRPTESWKGAVGHCQDHIMDKPVIENAHVFICGSNKNVIDISEKLINYGYSKERIHYEKFG